jgi:hypothetical protein
LNMHIDLGEKLKESETPRRHSLKFRHELEAEYIKTANDLWFVYKDKLMERIKTCASGVEDVNNVVFIDVDNVKFEAFCNIDANIRIGCYFRLKFLTYSGTQSRAFILTLFCLDKTETRIRIFDDSWIVNEEEVEKFKFMGRMMHHFHERELIHKVYPEANIRSELP